MKKVIYLPLDERPCNLAYVREVTRDNIALRVVTPGLGEVLKLGSLNCEMIVNRINEHTRVNFPGIFAKYEAVECYLPWSRLFEIGLKVEKRKK